MRNHQPMRILGIPDVLVLEVVHVRIETVRVHVDVRDEMYVVSPLPLQPYRTEIEVTVYNA